MSILLMFTVNTLAQPSAAIKGGSFAPARRGGSDGGGAPVTPPSSWHGGAVPENAYESISAHKLFLPYKY